MLGRHVRAGGARVLQLGGTTRDIYYYPQGTVEVAVAGPGTNAGAATRIPLSLCTLVYHF